jgi:ribosomal RNA-processing protein 8
MTDTNRDTSSSSPKRKVDSSSNRNNKMSKKKQSPDRVEAAKPPASPMSTSAKSQPSTPVNNDDPSTWTKSKKKRMRQKRKREEEAAAAKKLSMDGGESTQVVSSPKKQSMSDDSNGDDITNKRQKLEATKQPPADTNNDVESSPNKKKKKKNKKKKKDAATDDSPETTTKNSSTLNESDKSNKNATTVSSNNSTSTTSSNSRQQMKISLPKPSMMSTLQKAFLERLTSSRFRELNEDLYTKPSQDSFKQFTENPELFDQYHVGFRKQAKEWPANPVDVIYKKIVNTWKKDVLQGGSQGKKSKRENVVVADFGCGDAKLAERLLSLKVGSDGQLMTNQPSTKGKKGKQSDDKSSCPFEVYSFDLVSGGNPLVTPADMSNVPLSDESVDVGVYCLALMGTNVADFVRESWRVLKFNGVLRVAEVRSRFETTASAESKDDKQNKGKFGLHKKLKSRNNVHHQNNHQNKRNGNSEEDETPQPLMLLDEFMALMQRCGFQCTNMDRSNKMFLFMDFVKADGGSGLSEHENFSAKPCIYKRR